MTDYAFTARATDALGRVATRAQVLSVHHYLDELSSLPRAVLALRKLHSAATLSIRVRRSSDNTEQDIGFSGDALDVSALLSFVGAGSGYVRTFYDQTGNGEHAEQTTQANQPQIVNAGTYNGKLVFDGVNDSLKITSLSLGAVTCGVYSKVKYLHNGSLPNIFELSSNYNSVTGAFRIGVTAAGLSVGVRAATSYHAGSFVVPELTDTSLLSVLINAASDFENEITVFLDGSGLSPAWSNTTDVSAVTPTNDFYIGSRAGTSLYAAIDLKSVVLYANDSAANRAIIESIIG